MYVFLLLVLAEFVALLASHMLGFSLAISIYESSGSVAKFAIIEFAALVPETILSGFAGVLVDKYGPKKSLIMGQCGASIAMLGFGVFYWFGQLGFFQIVVLEAVCSTFNAFAFPAMAAAMKVFVNESQRGRAAGMAQLSVGLAQVLSPITAGTLMFHFQLGAVLFFTTVCALFAAAIVVFVGVSKRITKGEGAEPEQVDSLGFLHDFLQGLSFVRNRPELVWLLFFTVFVNFIFGGLLVLISPFILSFSDKEKLGAVMSIGGVGMLVGSALLSILGIPKKDVFALIFSVFILGFSIATVPLSSSINIISVAMFLVMFSWPILSCSNHIIWQRCVPTEIIGRVSGLRVMLGGTAIPISFLVTSAMADHIFEPLMEKGMVLSELFGRYLGVGEGRGIALMLVIGGASLMIAVVIFSTLSVFIKKGKVISNAA